MIQLKKTLLTLVALLAVTTGAWADETLLVTIESNANASFKSGSKTFDDKVTVTFSNSVENKGDERGWYSDNTESLLTVTGINGYKIISFKFYTYSGYAVKGYTVYGRSPSVYLSNHHVYIDDSKPNDLGSEGIMMIEVYGTAPTPVTFTRGTEEGKTNQWTMDGGMPAGNVLVTPQYAPVAAFAVENAGTANEKTLLPAAADGVIAGTTAPLIVEGTVANTTFGETTTAQGTVKYAVTDTKTTAPALTAFSASVPTAAEYDDATTVYVWYYIEGIEPENFADRTAQNTFDNSDICTEPLEVSVLTNKFTLTLDPAPVEKVTVTIDGTAVTDATQLQDGKIPEVKMGKTVKLAPKTGYKLRKVEVKKTQQQQP